MKLRIAHIAPVATTIPPGKSGSVEQMTSLLTEGLVARGHDVTLFATGDSTTSATLHAIYPHGYWHDEDMWPWSVGCSTSRPVGRRDFDHHYEAAFYPMSLAFARLSPTLSCRRCTIRRVGRSGALVALSRGALRRDSEEQGRCSPG